MFEMKGLILIGLIIILIGIILIIIGSFSEGNVKSAGIIFIGPIPIGWGLGKRLFLILAGIGIFLYILFFLLR